MKRLGVRMINIDFYPLLGGAQMHTLRLCRYLAAQGVEVEVITRHHAGLAYEEEIGGVRVVRTPIRGQSKAGAALDFVYHAMQRLMATRGQYQVIHSHEMLSPMTIGLLGRSLLGARLVVNPHRGGYLGDMYKMQQRGRFAGPLRLAWARRAGDAFISVSKEITAELLLGGIDAKKIHFIPYAMDTGHYKPVEDDCRKELRARFGLRQGDLYAVYTGRLVPEKGLDLLINAWAEVTRMHPTARLLLVGDGELRGALEGQVRQLGLCEHVRFTGAVEDTSLYLQACDLYVQSSFTEGLPIAMLEAMACGLPVVVTAVGGVSDLIRDGENGVSIPPRSVAAICEQVSGLLASPALRQRMGAAARQDVIAYCAIEQVGAAHINLYRSLAG